MRSNNYVIPSALLIETIKYMSHRPYVEVYDIIPKLQTLLPMDDIKENEMEGDTPQVNVVVE